jgi:hypothetical protein
LTSRKDDCNLKRFQLPSRHVILVLAATAVTLAVAACGSSSNTKSSSTSANASGAAGATANVAACLRKHGVTLPAGGNGQPPAGGNGQPPAGGPPPGGASGGPPNGSGSAPAGFPGGANASKFQAALKACGVKVPARPNGARLSRGAIQKYVACVRQHGYKLANPNFSGKGPVFPADIRSNTKFEKASAQCQSLLGAASAGGAPAAASG